MTTHRPHDGVNSGAPTDMVHADPLDCGRDGLPCLVCEECRAQGATAETDARARQAAADHIDWLDRATTLRGDRE